MVDEVDEVLIIQPALELVEVEVLLLVQVEPQLIDELDVNDVTDENDITSEREEDDELVVLDAVRVIVDELVETDYAQQYLGLVSGMLEVEVVLDVEHRTTQIDEREVEVDYVVRIVVEVVEVDDKSAVRSKMVMYEVVEYL